MDNELLLADRIGVIRDTINKYGADNFYLSFSGGKDSTILHYLIDMALPNNNIPRVYINTGIEYNDIVAFVKDLASNDKRFVIIKPTKPIKQTLETYGYPFKSKQHSHNHKVFTNNKVKVLETFEKIENDKTLLTNYDFIHNLPNGVKTIVKYFYGVRERERSGVVYSYLDCP